MVGMSLSFFHETRKSVFSQILAIFRSNSGVFWPQGDQYRRPESYQDIMGSRELQNRGLKSLGECWTGKACQA